VYTTGVRGVTGVRGNGMRALVEKQHHAIDLVYATRQALNGDTDESRD
jgi:hypothetical protein